MALSEAKDEDGTLAHLCAAAVVFLCLVEANRRLKADGTTGPDLMAMLDLVGLATVADVAPLVGVNRALVQQGLKVLRDRRREPAKRSAHANFELRRPGARRRT